MKKGAIENTLRDFGLTEKEVEVYIFLGKRGALKGRDVTKQLRMHKGQVYRTLKSLQKKGLVESTLEYPARFIAVPFEKLIDSFIKSKREEVALIEEKKEDLLSDWNRISQAELDFSLEKFSVIEGNKKIFHKISQMVKETISQFSLALTVSDLFRAEQFGVFEFVDSHPMKSKIQFQALTQLSKQNLKAVKILKPKLNSVLVFRGINPELGLPPFSRMVIRDNEEIILFISDRVDQSAKEGKEVCLCTNCKSIIQAFSGVFKDSWQNSTNIEQLIDLIETGKAPPKTEIIKDPSSAKESYYEILNSANEEILIVTSSEGLIGVSKNKSQLEEWAERGVSIRIMAPIVTENLDVVQSLLKWCEVRHIPLGYFETTIIDGHHLFQFNPASPTQRASRERSYFANTFYTTDLDYIQKTKNLLYDIWRKTRTPSSESIRSITRSLIASPKSAIGHHSLFKKTIVSKNMKYQQIGKITEKDVLDRIIEEKKHSFQSSNWFDVWWYFGSRAFAVIHPSEILSLPDLVIGILHNEKESTFGSENTLIIDIKKETKNGYSYVPVTFVQDNSKVLETRKKAFGDYAGKVKFLILKKKEFYVQIKGNTLFAGWTKPIPIGFSNYVLPPSCLLFEGYGEVKPGMLTNSIPGGRRQEIWFNSFDAFVTYFHPKSKYIGSGSDGFIERDSLFMSIPTET